MSDKDELQQQQSVQLLVHFFFRQDECKVTSDGLIM